MLTHANSFKDGIHLLDNGKQILAIFLNVNRTFLMPCTFHPDVRQTVGQILFSTMIVLKRSHLILKNVKTLD